jgi:hypothetical protein
MVRWYCGGVENAVHGMSTAPVLRWNSRNAGTSVSRVLQYPGGPEKNGASGSFPRLSTRRSIEEEAEKVN